jgi:hypothetical protein
MRVGRSQWLLLPQLSFLRFRVPAYARRRTGRNLPVLARRVCLFCGRCARNCFMCPNCRNTLSVVPSDPPDPGDGRIAIPISTVGEPPFFLYCNHCRWDSAEVGITFEKPTGLAGSCIVYKGFLVSEKLLSTTAEVRRLCPGLAGIRTAEGAF